MKQKQKNTHRASAPPREKKPRRTKYNNRRKDTAITATAPDGTKHAFDSVLEAEVFLRLCHLQKIGRITEIIKQVPFDLVPPHGTYKKPLRFTADFIAVRRSDGKSVIVEAKSPATAKARDYPIRKRLLSCVTACPILEVSDPDKFLDDALAGKLPI